VIVAAGVVFDQRGRVLLQQRNDTSHQGGLWEFPGGKVEVGESVYQALCREFVEELGIQVNKASPLIRVNHQYPDLLVELDVWLIKDHVGKPQPLEAQPLKWLAPKDLHQLPMPAADLPVIEALLERC
jgi:8-oxo-dGTP diphosphatase